MRSKCILNTIFSFIFLFAGSYSWGYDGPLFDKMAQIDERVDMEKVMRRAQEAGVDKMALFARSRKSLGENEEDVLSLRKSFTGFLFLGSPKYFLMRNDLSIMYNDSIIEGIQRHGYHFIGEILYTHGDKSHGKQTRQGERYIDPLGKGTENLLSRIKKFNIPLMTHWEVYAWGRDWPRFSRLYSTHPEQTFIIPHMAFGSPEQVNQILSKHANVYMTLSKKLTEKGGYSDSIKQAKLGSAILDGGKDLRGKWESILIKYQDRVLFATDAHKRHRWKKYHKVVKRYRQLANQLPEDVAEKISYRNAEKLYKVKIK